MNNIKGSLILLLAAVIWGTAFVAQTSGAGAVGTFTFNAARSIVGALFLAVVIVIKNVLDKRNNSGKKPKIAKLTPILKPTQHTI